MKYIEINKKTKNELIDLLKDLKKETYNLRFQKKNGQLKKTERIKQVKKEIARKKTKRELTINFIGKINEGNFKKSEFDNLIKEKNISSKKVSIKNLNDGNKIKIPDQMTTHPRSGSIRRTHDIRNLLWPIRRRHSRRHCSDHERP